jgi:hypothetical protein
VNDRLVSKGKHEAMKRRLSEVIMQQVKGHDMPQAHKVAAAAGRCRYDNQQ